MLQAYEAAALGGFLATLKGSNLQARRPSWAAPNFWARCIIQQLARPIPALSDFRTIITVTGRPAHVGVVNRFVATSYGDLAIAQLRFRWLLDGNLIAGTSYGTGVELNKEGPNTYPTIPRSTFITILEPQTLELQVANDAALQYTALCAVYGWYYATVDGSAVAVDRGISDASYPPLTGEPS